MSKIRIYDALNGCVVHEEVDTGLVQLIYHNSVVAEALPNRPTNYNRIVSKITSYLSTVPDGTRDYVVEENVELLHPVSAHTTDNSLLPKN